MRGSRIGRSVQLAISGLSLGSGLSVGTTASGQCDTNETVKLTASDAAEDDVYGFAVSISASVVVIGAHQDDDGGSNSGSAYVYRFDPDTAMWIEEQKLTASDAFANAAFGISVCISGDVIVIGSPQHGGNGISSGAAYVFRYNGSTWEEEMKLLPSDAASGDAFGRGVFVSGDLAVVGAYLNDDAGGSSGSAYVYRFDSGGGRWNEEAKLTASDGAAGDQFGLSVSIGGDLAVIGAHRDGDAGGSSGSAYVYRFDSEEGRWNEEAKLAASDAEGGDRFGISVSLSNDRIAIGARGNDDAGNDTGSAYIFRSEDGGIWIEEAKLTASDATAGDLFGRAVSVSDDTVVIGASGNEDAGNNSGSGYVFRRNDIEWFEEAKFTASDASDGNNFGFSVAVAGDSAVIGTRNPNGESQSGAAYVFSGLSDCNENGELDICDIADGTSEDDNGNGIPDECEIKDLVLDLDIKPGSCPNPLNRNSHGMMPAAVLGTDDFDAAQIDISSVLISRTDGIGGSAVPNEGPPGPHSVLEDVGTPFNGELCDCHELEGDGAVDLLMHFQTQEVVEALELDDLPPGTFVELTVTGVLRDKTPFSANDCVRLVPPGDMDGDGAVGAMDLIMLISSWGSCAECIECPVDLDGDCNVGAADLLILLGNWG
ncbi:MAG: FG-GAP repeat protein [Planctomycetes bacterium]|nr:FG-GAP repeat protein [Planctomycetota bacterium]